MKLGKKAKVADIENPHRPKFGVPRKYTVCRITMGSTIPKEDESHLNMQVDADDEPTFVREVESLVPSNKRYRDVFLELWFISPEYQELVTDLALDYFAQIVTVNEAGTISTIKGKCITTP